MFVAQYSEYTRPLIDHLVQQKLAHWDRWGGDIQTRTVPPLKIRHKKIVTFALCRIFRSKKNTYIAHDVDVMYNYPSDNLCQNLEANKPNLAACAE